jgi:hypothetical protein
LAAAARWQFGQLGRLSEQLLLRCFGPGVDFMKQFRHKFTDKN